MTEPEPSPEWEQAPPIARAVAGAINGVSAGVSGAVRAVLTRVNRSLLFGAIAVSTGTLFLGVLVLSIAKSPSIIEGVIGGLFAGFFLAALFLLGALTTVVSTLGGRSKTTTDRKDAARAGTLDTLLGPTLRELTAARAEVAAAVRRRSRIRVPVAVAAAVLIWTFGRWSDDPPGALDLFVWVGLAALAGEIWAAHKPSEEYRRLYKDRVLPVLAAQFGGLTYRHGSVPELDALRTHRVFGDFDKVTAEDEIAGTYRGLPLRIVELKLEDRSGKDTRVVFNGLLVEIVLPRRLTGTTVIAAGKGGSGLFATFRFGDLEEVRLEDPRFHERYRVASTDQIEARALLTPAFMERFTKLAELSGFSLPGALAVGNRLMIALPKRTPVDLFEPPVYWKPAGGRALVALSNDIAAVLKMADAVIELDFWARGEAGAAAQSAAR